MTQLGLTDGGMGQELLRCSKAPPTPTSHADFAIGGARSGAAIVGGCCEVGPAHIAALRDRLPAENFTLAAPSAMGWAQTA